MHTEEKMEKSDENFFVGGSPTEKEKQRDRKPDTKIPEQNANKFVCGSGVDSPAAGHGFLRPHTHSFAVFSWSRKAF